MPTAMPKVTSPHAMCMGRLGSQGFLREMKRQLKVIQREFKEKLKEIIHRLSDVTYTDFRLSDLMDVTLFQV